MIERLVALLVTGAVVSASWQGQDRDSPPQLPCSPCSATSAGRADSNHRGFGADNLGYDWSPKAWGGPAFPSKPTDWDDRRGKSMGEHRYHTGVSDCPECIAAATGGHGIKHDGQADLVATVTSQVLGIRLRDDRRVGVEWPGRSMRWDGFRNGMSWDRMERRDDQPWEESSRTENGKGYYAADWNYQSPNRNQIVTEKPWSMGWHRDGYKDHRDGGAYQPSTQRPRPVTDRWPAGQNKQYGNDRPPHNNAIYPTTSNPYNPNIGSQEPHSPQYPSQGSPPPSEFYIHRPSYGPAKPSGPEYPTNNRYGASPGVAIWNPDRPSGATDKNTGYYTGIITEISSPSHGGGQHGSYGNGDLANLGNNNYYHYETANRKPQHTYENDRYGPNNVNSHNNKYPYGSTNDLYIKNNYDYYGPSKYPTPRPVIDRNPYGSGDRYGYRPVSSNYGGEEYNQQQYGSPINHIYPSDYDRNKRYPNDNDRNNRYPSSGYHDNDFNKRPPSNPGASNSGGDYAGGSSPNSNAGNWNYGEQTPYRRSGGSYPPYKGGNYFTSSYLSSASTPPSENHSGSETTQATTGSQ